MSPHRLKSDISAYAHQQGADLIGFVSTQQLNVVTPTRYTPSRLWPEAKTAISIGKRLLTGALAVGTGDMVQNARWVAWRTNEFLNNCALEIGHFVEKHGFRALPLSNGTMVDPKWNNMGLFGELSHRHVAAEAGLGTIGVATYIVTPQFGPRIFFNTILTDAELEPDPKLDFNPCDQCPGECVKACPTGAIIRGRRTIKKRLCIPRANPQGFMVLQDYINSVIGASGFSIAAPADRGLRFCTSSSGPCARCRNSRGMLSLPGGVPRGIRPEGQNPVTAYLKN